MPERHNLVFLERGLIYRCHILFSQTKRMLETCCIISIWIRDHLLHEALSKWFYDTSTGAATGAVRCGSFVGEVAPRWLKPYTTSRVLMARSSK
jgi:hypothetical protein